MKKSLLTASITAALSLTQSIAFAEDDAMIVTSTRIDALASLPASVTTITASDIKKSPARTLPELLSQEVGINISSIFSHGSRASIGLRGFGATSTQNTLILLDGRRLNDIDISSVNYAAIPFENIDRIEIIRGSGSVLYGDGATGGVINIITKDPSKAKNETTLGVTAGSYDHREVDVTTSFSNEYFGLSANINSQENDGYRDHNSFDQNSGQFDLRVPIGEGEVYVKAGAFQQNIEFPGARRVDLAAMTNELNTDRNGTKTPNDWGDEYTEFATLGYSVDLNDQDSLIVDAGYRRKRTRSSFEDYDFGGLYSSYAETSIKTLSLTPRLMLARQLAGHSMDWILGMDLYHYQYDSNRSVVKSDIGQPIHQLDMTQESAALYGQGTVALTDKTSLTAGARVQNVRQKARHVFDGTAPGVLSSDTQAPDFTESDTEESYELGIKHLLTDNWSLYARADRSARFGTIDELYESEFVVISFVPFTGRNDYFFSRLKPQVSRGVEAGVSYKNDWLTSTLSVFHQKITDEIYFDPTVFDNVNLDDTRHEGVELSATAKLNQVFTIKGGYTYLSAEFADGLNDGKRIPLVPEHAYNASLLATLPHGVAASINWNYVSASFFANDPTNTFVKKIPSYQTVDVKLSKELGPLELALQVNNIFDEEYYNYGVNSSFGPVYNAYPLAERNAYLSANYTFN